MFKFRLQTVLDCRTILEEKMQLRFSEAVRRLDEETRRLDILDNEKCDLVGILKSLQGNATPVEDVSLLVRYIGDLQTREYRQREIIHEVGVEVEEKRKELLESAQKRKILEKLREKNLEEYNSHLTEQDRKAMDEMGIIRHGRVNP